MDEKTKAYCRLCKHCMKVLSYANGADVDAITCRHDPIIIDSFYSPKYQYKVCKKKNKNNTCPFFEDTVTPVLDNIEKELDKMYGVTVPRDQIMVELTLWQRIKQWLSH